MVVVTVMTSFVLVIVTVFASAADADCTAAARRLAANMNEVPTFMLRQRESSDLPEEADLVSWIDTMVL